MFVGRTEKNYGAARNDAMWATRIIGRLNKAHAQPAAWVAIGKDQQHSIRYEHILELSVTFCGERRGDSIGHKNRRLGTSVNIHVAPTRQRNRWRRTFARRARGRSQLVIRENSDRADVY